MHSEKNTENIIKNPNLYFVIFLLIAAGIGLSGKHVLYGDGREYIIQTQSIIINKSFYIDTKKSADYWNKTNPYGMHLGETNPPSKVLSEQAQAWGNFGGLYPDKSGNYRYYHFWIYPLLSAPFYYAFRLAGISPSFEYFSFRFLNVILLLGIYFLLWKNKRNFYMLIFLILSLFTPLISYCDWQHPEILCLFLLLLAFKGIGIKSLRYISPVFILLVSFQFLPAIIFLPLHFIINYKSNPRPESLRSRMFFALGYIAAVIFALIPVIYFYWYFNVPNVISHIGLASAKYMTLNRAFNVFFSPLAGAIFFYHLCFFFLPVCVKKENIGTFLLMLISVFAAAYLCTATRNFNSGQIGALRYTIWLIAPLLYFISEWMPGKISSNTMPPDDNIIDTNPSNARRYLFIPAVCASLIFILYFKYYPLAVKDISNFAGTNRAKKETARLYRYLPVYDDVETITENIMAAEINQPSDFNGIYIWDIGRKKQIWIISEASLGLLQSLKIIYEDENKSKKENANNSKENNSAKDNNAENKNGISIKASVSPKQKIAIIESESVISIGFENPPIMYVHPVYGKYLIIHTTAKIQSIITGEGRREKIRIKSDKITIM